MHQRHLHNPSFEKTIMSLALQCSIDVFEVYERKAWLFCTHLLLNVTYDFITPNSAIRGKSLHLSRHCILLSLGWY